MVQMARETGPLAKKLDVSPADLTDGDGGVSDISDRQLFGMIQGTVKHGSGTSAMPQWGLAMPGNQIESIVSFIRFLQNSKHPLLGDPRVGKRVYEDNCAACHGRSGKGDGPLAAVLDLKAMDHTNGAELNKHPKLSSDRDCNFWNAREIIDARLEGNAYPR